MQDQNPTDVISPKILLVVDDEKMNRFLLRKMVEQDGYTVIEANDGKEAVKEVHLHSFAVVLMDVRMPNMDGLEASSIISKEFPRLPIIVITAEPLEVIAGEGRRSGVDAFLSKPVHKVDLLDMIKKTIASKSS